MLLFSCMGNKTCVIVASNYVKGTQTRTHFKPANVGASSLTSGTTDRATVVIKLKITTTSSSVLNVHRNHTGDSLITLSDNRITLGDNHITKITPPPIPKLLSRLRRRRRRRRSASTERHVYGNISSGGALLLSSGRLLT